ncbi:tryptophan 7-halogenase [Qipengyuania sp. GH1]|uniref:tryptophan halogenase family protein n=1 Tax=Qipengyuania aestuarii TaxID=2867241 RepID=UPI001C887EF6|nr:tryptophan halogenase family protein [Qipengyuania aestuarii]MBX7536178.1 tryptophan 7-halogenase [Qipengyuania aestuarii]
MTGGQPVRVVIAGGGTAGWISACALSRQLGRLVEVTLVESDAIPTIGVGEATIPTARSFHEYLRIDERLFMSATGATFKLGIRFDDWGALGDSYMHSFGTFEMRNWVAEFQHFWLEGRDRGAVHPIGAYCLEHEAALAGKFTTAGKPNLNYAYHLDAGRYAAFLRAIAERDGARRVEGRIATVEQHPETGEIAALLLESGDRIEGDLFIDCTGFRALLIGKTLGVGYEDWSHWLPTDGAWAVQTEATEQPPPYTIAAAHEAGWQWRIPLQHRTGNGLVFASDYLEIEEAREKLLENIAGEAVSDPRLIRFETGRRETMWSKNCVSLGLSSGFIEPLESTSIHLIMSGVTRLIQLFPFGGEMQSLRRRWNALADYELEHVRDFVILHYHLTKRADSEFWRSRAAMDIPATLKARLENFTEHAQAWQDAHELFRTESWLYVMLGQGLMPRHWHRLAGLMDDKRLIEILVQQRDAISSRVAEMPAHGQFIASYAAER